MLAARYTKIFVLVTILYLASCSPLNYSVIINAEASCFPKNICKSRDTSLTVEETSCDCDDLCSSYRTCCIDKIPNNNARKLYKRSWCTTIGDISVFTVDICNRKYNESSEISKRCESGFTDWSDPFAYAPVTNQATGITYKSLYCAICNLERPQALTLWQVTIDCTSLGSFMKVCNENREFVLNNMMYIKNKGQWGLWSSDEKGDWKFRFLNIAYKLPDELKDSVKFCRPDLISKCVKDWVDEDEKQLCNSYMGAVYFPEGAFRNVHCAICNRVRNVTELSCTPLYTSPFRGKPSMSFTLLLDINTSDGNIVGEVNRCPKKQSYDPFAKICRTLVCALPGYRMIEERCVRENRPK